MTDRIDTGVGPDTKILANILNYDDDMAILQQGSVKSIKRYFQRVENPESLGRDSFGSTSVSIDRENRPIIRGGDKRYTLEPGVSINSVSFIARLIILILILIVVWDFLRTK